MSLFVRLVSVMTLGENSQSWECLMSPRVFSCLFMCRCALQLRLCAGHGPEGPQCSECCCQGRGGSTPGKDCHASNSSGDKGPKGWSNILNCLKRKNYLMDSPIDSSDFCYDTVSICFNQSQDESHRLYDYLQVHESTRYLMGLQQGLNEDSLWSNLHRQKTSPSLILTLSCDENSDSTSTADCTSMIGF